MRLEYILEQLHRMCRVAQQLESCWLRFRYMARPCVEAQAAPAVEAQPAAADSERPLVLRFTNPDTVTDVTIRMPRSAALRSDFVKPQLRVQLRSLDPAETQRQYCEALQETVLSKLEPSTTYISALCNAMSETLHVPADG